MITADDLKRMLQAISDLLNAHVDELNQLDANLGDGDHGTGISTGFTSASEAVITQNTPTEVLKVAASAVMNRMGGSSGALFGTLLLKAALTVKDHMELSPVQFADMLIAGKDGVAQRGKAQPGDKTMLDALVPATTGFKDAIINGQSFIDALAVAVEAAELGAQATATMQAKFGRAKFLGERSIGHIDPGARSTTLMFQAIYTYWENTHHGEA